MMALEDLCSEYHSPYYCYSQVIHTPAGLKEDHFHEVIDKFILRYEKILSAIGKALTLQRLWEDSRVNAGTLGNGIEVIIYLYGGFPRHPEITADGYALVLCHELGHHLGGLPEKSNEWSGACHSKNGHTVGVRTVYCFA